ncbi:hypothetical protein MAR_022294, partial [Mya arenaria]
MSFSSKKRRKAKKNPVEEESGFGSWSMQLPNICDIRNFASLGHATNRTKQRTHLTDLTREHGHDTSDMLSCTDCWRKDQQIIHLQDQLQREKYLQRQIDDMKEKANARIKQLEDQIRATSSQIDGLQQSFQKERREKEDALTRLSSLASSKLRDNNPNITDLSDQNRPTKIAEKMSELYDNEWTE